MGLRFFNRKGMEIRQSIWQKLTRKPGYCRVQRDTFDDGKIVLETSWVGLVSELVPEDLGIFLVELYEPKKCRGRQASKRIRLRDDEWFYREQDARQCHEDLVRELKALEKS